MRVQSLNIAVHILVDGIAQIKWQVHSKISGFDILGNLSMVWNILRRKILDVVDVFLLIKQ